MTTTTKPELDIIDRLRFKPCVPCDTSPADLLLISRLEKLFDDAADEIERLRYPQWQGISTAPKDGTKLILGWFNESGKFRTCLGWYAGKFTLEQDDPYDEDGDWHEGVGTYYAKEGWYEDSQTHEDVVAIAPTHWQPLPTPPVGE